MRARRSEVLQAQVRFGEQSVDLRQVSGNAGPLVLRFSIVQVFDGRRPISARQGNQRPPALRGRVPARPHSPLLHEILNHVDDLRGLGDASLLYVNLRQRRLCQNQRHVQAQPRAEFDGLAGLPQGLDDIPLEEQQVGQVYPRSTDDQRIVVLPRLCQRLLRIAQSLFEVSGVEVNAEENTTDLAQVRAQTVGFRERQRLPRVIAGPGIVTLHLEDVSQVTVRTRPLPRIAVRLQQVQGLLQMTARQAQVSLQVVQSSKAPVDPGSRRRRGMLGEQFLERALRLLVPSKERQNLAARKLRTKQEGVLRTP